jgi:Uma2 family endonuclease
MPSETLISVAEYLATSYRPDCDYIDGHIEERNLGEWDHANLQTAIAAYFRNNRKKWGINVVVEQRVQVSPSRFRIPDVCVIVGDPDGQILRKPPFICIEVVSPEDRMKRVNERIDDYLKMGVSYVWVLDPETRKAYVATRATGLTEVMSGVLKTENPALEMPLAEIFE